MNRTQALCIALGWQGGTIHQVAEATGLSVDDILSGDSPSNSTDFAGGWFAVRTCTLEFNQRVNYPKNKGNKEFWLGVARGLQIMTEAELKVFCKNQQT